MFMKLMMQAFLYAWETVFQLTCISYSSQKN